MKFDVLKSFFKGTFANDSEKFENDIVVVEVKLKEEFDNVMY